MLTSSSVLDVNYLIMNLDGGIRFVMNLCTPNGWQKSAPALSQKCKPRLEHDEWRLHCSEGRA